jgi:hypothetical protein
MAFHVEAEFTHDAQGRLVRLNEPNGAPAPRFFLGRTADGVLRRFRHDVNDETRNELEAASNLDAAGECALERAIPSSPYEEILARSAPVQRIWTGPAFSFPAALPSNTGAILVTDVNSHILEPHLRTWTPDDVSHCQPMFVVTVDGCAVSICASVRRTGDAHEAGVETALDYRGRGYAARVVVAWAAAVGQMGRVPLYSTSWKNAASRAVARKLGLIQFGSDLHIT